MGQWILVFRLETTPYHGANHQDVRAEIYGKLRPGVPIGADAGSWSVAHRGSRWMMPIWFGISEKKIRTKARRGGNEISLPLSWPQLRRWFKMSLLMSYMLPLILLPPGAPWYPYLGGFSMVPLRTFHRMSPRNFVPDGSSREPKLGRRLETTDITV